MMGNFLDLHWRKRMQTCHTVVQITQTWEVSAWENVRNCLSFQKHQFPLSYLSWTEACSWKEARMGFFKFRDSWLSSCISMSARCPVWFYILCSSLQMQIEKQLLEVILHSCEKCWYSSPGFITYLPCDVNASPGGLMSVALVQARVSLQTTGVAVWLSPGISRVAHVGHCSAGSAHFHYGWLMKRPLWANTCSIDILFTGPSWDVHLSMLEKVERWKLLPLWSSNLHRYVTGWGRGQADADSLLHVCGVGPINIFPLERAADAAAVVAVKPVEPCGDLNSTMVSNGLEKSFPDFGMWSCKCVQDN